MNNQSAIKFPLFVLAISVTAGFFSASAYANCNVKKTDAGCLSASYEHQGEYSWGGYFQVKKTTWTAKNHCPELGDVVMKLERRLKSSKYPKLTGGSQQSGTVDGKVTGIKCCPQRGDLCNISDVVSDASCKQQYKSSSADNTCKNENIYKGTAALCTIKASCKKTDGSYRRAQTAHVEYWNVPKLRNCNGTMTLSTNCYMPNSGM